MLDPEVAGVLPVCIGNATRVSDYVMDMGKAYEANCIDRKKYND